MGKRPHGVVKPMVTGLGLLSRANPMLNLPAKDLGFESQSSSSDLDHIR